MKYIAIIFLFIFANCYAAEDYYNFANQKEKERFQSLTSELRCLVCQNQNLAESNAPLASDLRQQIYQKILKGESDKTIIQFLVSRYSEFILYRPPFSSHTAALWLSPFLILLFGVSFLFYYVRKIPRR